MPTNRNHLLEIMKEELLNVEEKRTGYRQELMATLADILMLEHENSVKGLNIQQKVSEKCQALGEYLAKK